MAHPTSSASAAASSAATVLVLDFGSQYTQLIARRIRERHVYCEIHPCTLSAERIRALAPKAVILSGGPASVYEEGAPGLPHGVLELGVPVLGICYGLQVVAHERGGRVEPAPHREYGPARVVVERSVGILARFPVGTELSVWMSHGDRLVAPPAGCERLAGNESAPFAAVGDEGRRLYGVQFHPEVVHTPRGGELLDAFLFDVAGIEPDWTPTTIVDDLVGRVQRQVGDATAVLGLSGGVDSSVAAVLCQRALGNRLHCIFVDNGLLRAGEREAVESTFRTRFHLQLQVIDASEAFLSALEGVTDPEQKRKIIGRVFVEVFEACAKQVENARFLVQGTLYPDVIESVSFKGGPSVVIKSHHNVGGLPERMNLGLVEPLRELFKDEVRQIGECLGMPHDVLYRHPFPGPGLAVRCPGALSRARLEALRQADAIFEEEVRASGWYERLWQSFCVLLPVRSVGVMGDGRTYEETIVLRAVHSVDGMTADWARLDHELVARVSTRIINEVRGVNRVLLDVSSKPPSTIEWE
jgi:GMP synthase (glutamine-hydrolysing)